MSVGFRSFLTIEAGSYLGTVIEHLDRWSRFKEIDIPAGAPGRYVLDPDDIITIARHHESGRSVYRWRRLHPFARGMNEIWRTTITAVEVQDAPGWLWTEIEVADDESDRPARVPFMSVPSVLRELLAELPCRDGLVPTSTKPTWVGPDDLPDLMDYLADDTRLGPVYVARQGARDADGFHAWATDVMWEVVGLGNAFLLGASVEQEFNDMVGELHSIPEGAIRTYLPGVDLDDPRDPRRHQILGSVRIDRSGPRRLAYIFGLSQRDRGILALLPAEAWEVERMLLAGEAAEYYGTAPDLRIVPNGAPLNGASSNGVAQNGVTPNGVAPNGVSPNGVAPNGVARDASKLVPDGASFGHVAAAEPVPARGRDGAGQPASILSRRGQHRRLVELLEENEHLRAEVERLQGAMRAYQHSDVAVLAALETLEAEVKSLRHRLGLDATRGAPQLNAS
ncbi:hypothetical protein [Jiangella asiatica]|uniref:Uncharacterized protein n=1 Tax=Jiangella asiatica TaxID=2530372 RepID=A0A4R5DHL2_9ACTN|nr:hypothetical protein [Jiangella asiatica]TDE13572.1 hypothetical protein E1269_05965 [Jiangella asiatica]